MATRQTGKVAAPVKQKQRKNHGPKRHMFKVFKPMLAVFAQSGVLSKYYNYESFVQSVGSKGVRTMTAELWERFSVLSLADKKEFLKNIKEQEMAAAKRKENQEKKMAKKVQKPLPNKTK